MADEQNLADEEIDIDESAAEPSKKKGSFLSPFLVKILLIIAFAVGTIFLTIIVSLIVVKFVTSRAPQVRPDSWDDQVRNVEVEHYEYLELDEPFRQQLLDGKMIQLKITLAYKSKDKSLQQEISQIKPEIRDIIIKHLSHLSSEDFVDVKSGGSALEKIEADFLKQINRILNSGRIERILFQEYTLM